jgi:hypothetical protein
VGKDSKPAPAPDPLIGQAAQQNVELGREALAFARQQYEEGKIRQEDLDELTKKVADSALASQGKSEEWALQDRDISNQLRGKYDAWANQDRVTGQATKAWSDGVADSLLNNAAMYEKTYGAEAARQSEFGQEEVARYRDKFRPVQDQIVSDAMTWDSAGRLDSEAAKAKSDVMSNAQAQRDASQRSMMSMGVNPNSGRFAGVERATDTMTALGAAGAQNSARDNARMQAQQLRGQAASLGQQVLANGQQANQISLSAVGAGQQARLAGTSAAMQAKNLGLAAAGIGNTSAGLSVGNQGAGYQGIGSGIQAGNAAIGATQAGTQGWMSNNGVMQGGFGTAIGANQSGAGIANGLYGNQLNAWGMQQQANATNNSTIGALLGTGAALYM